MYSRPVSRSFRRNAVLGISGDAGTPGPSGVVGVFGPPGDADGDAGGERRASVGRVPGSKSDVPGVASRASSSSASIAGFVATICETSSEPLDASVGEALASVPATPSASSHVEGAPVGFFSLNVRVSHDGPGSSAGPSPSGSKNSSSEDISESSPSCTSSRDIFVRVPRTLAGSLPPPRFACGSRQQYTKGARQAFSNRLTKWQPDRAAFPGKAATRPLRSMRPVSVERASRRDPRTSRETQRSRVCRARLAKGG